MFSIKRTDIFNNWLDGLKDERAFAKIMIRIDRLAAGNPGDVKDVGDGFSELRIDYGPGYRVYYVRRGKTIYLLLCGGDKRTQSKDIKEAKRIAKEWTDDET